MLLIQGITAGYEKHIVLQDVSMNVAPGEFVGLLGPNGCGKTTLLRVISGILTPRSGQVILDGRNILTMTRRTWAQTAACLMQDMGMDTTFTVREVALLGRSPHLPRFGWESHHDHAIAQKAMEEADIAHLADRPVSAISGGERQRAFFAMCLAQGPRLLLLDEPVNHLDLGHQIQLLECVRRLNRQNKLTVVGVFHDLNLASEYCDRLLVLRNGRIEAAGTPGEVVTPELIDRVYGAKVVVEANAVSGRPHVVVAAGSH